MFYFHSFSRAARGLRVHPASASAPHCRVWLGIARGYVEYIFISFGLRYSHYRSLIVRPNVIHLFITGRATAWGRGDLAFGIGAFGEGGVLGRKAFSSRPGMCNRPVIGLHCPPIWGSFCKPIKLVEYIYSLVLNAELYTYNFKYIF